MKRWLIVFTVALSMVVLFNPGTPQAASAKGKAASATMGKPQAGGVYNVIIRARNNLFGYPPRIVGAGKDFAPPFFDRLFSVGDDGKYKPELALSWDTSKDGKTITFKLRKGVKFHDGTDFNAAAVKFNLDRLIPPNQVVLRGVTSVDIVNSYTVKLTLAEYDNLILFHLAVNPATWMYSPTAVRKNGEDWATTHPVGTGPFMLKDYQQNVSLTLVKNPNYWKKGLPYLDGIKISMVPDPMTQMLTLKAGQANAIYDATAIAATQLKKEGYTLQSASGSFMMLTFDTKNSEIFSKPKIREAIEYAIDKETICNGPGEGLYTPVYQIASVGSPDYNPACPPRKYDTAKAKKLLEEAGYPDGFSFKLFVVDQAWREGWVAIQSNLANVGIKMDINVLNAAAFNVIKGTGKIEKGASASSTFFPSKNTLFPLEFWWRSDSNINQYVVRPAGIDKLIDQAKSARAPATIAQINQQIIKLIYDDQTVVPLWLTPRIAILDKSVQDTGWFINDDDNNNQFGHRTWLKK